MDKPVCSEDDESVLSYVKSREGKTWTASDTLAVKAKMKELMTQLGIIKSMAQEALEIDFLTPVDQRGRDLIAKIRASKDQRHG